ncbi:hypothetical protein C7399_13232 [Paraburkholderia tropica]|uniref:Uncharacterized protein n=1 Tax=Paraburkholderia tropica TaxID=92647 RepID=A0ABX5MEP6_9BURK|nr:hypothetical protein C7400_13232 [Paraburkholderia tropica]PZW72490.1 hypothetical protein C7399_13232 [Paraburkholderia tropica]
MMPYGTYFQPCRHLSLIAILLTESVMQNAEANPTQRQQNEMAAKGPAKTPAAGSASP